MDQVAGAGTHADGAIAKQTEALTAVAAALGEVTSLAIRASQIAQYSIADLEWLIVPAIRNRQFLIVRAPAPQSAVALPSAAILWSSVSDAIDAQLRSVPGQRLKLSAEERRSGDHIWITDLIGHPTLLQEAMRNLVATRFKGQLISYFARNAEGADIVVDHRSE